MKVLKKERSQNTVTLEIEVGYPQFKQAFDLALSQAGSQVKLPGFRPGKAPKSMVEKVFDPKAIEDRAAQDLIADLYPQIIKETGIDPVDYPSVDILTLKEGQPFVFKIIVTVYPEIKLGKYKGLKAEKRPALVTEEEVLHTLGTLQNRFAKRVEITDRGVLKNDNLDLEIEADAAGEKIKRWPRKLQFFPVGGSLIGPEFDEQLINLKVGDSKEFKIKFPTDHKVPEIAGREVSFKIRIEKIRGAELLPLDDEFAKSISRFGTLAELKAEILKSLELEKKEEAEADLKNKLIDEVSQGSQVELPEALVRTETDILLDELKTSLARSNLTLENYLKSIKKNETELRNELKAPATQRVKGKVVLRKISELEKITVTPQDLESEIKLLAKSADKSEEEYKKTLGEGGLHYIQDYLSRRKALNYLIENAQIKEGGPK
jgi:trigger factor